LWHDRSRDLSLRLSLNLREKRSKRILLYVCRTLALHTITHASKHCSKWVYSLRRTLIYGTGRWKIAILGA
jgi:hypothetical protein